MNVCRVCTQPREAISQHLHFDSLPVSPPSHHCIWRLLCLCHVILHMHPVVHLHRCPDSTQAHGQDVLGGGAVVAAAHVAPERVLHGKRVKVWRVKCGRVDEVLVRGKKHTRTFIPTPSAPLPSSPRSSDPQPSPFSPTPLTPPLINLQVHRLNKQALLQPPSFSSRSSKPPFTTPPSLPSPSHTCRSPLS